MPATKRQDKGQQRGIKESSLSFSSYLRDKGTKKRGKLQIPEVFIHIGSPVSLKFQKARSKISRRNRRNTQKILNPNRSLDCYALMKPSFCHLFRLFSVTMEPHCALKAAKHLFKNKGYYHHNANDRFGLKVIYNAGNGIFKNILYIEVDKKAAFIVMVLQF